MRRGAREIGPEDAGAMAWAGAEVGPGCERVALGASVRWVSWVLGREGSGLAASFGLGKKGRWARGKDWVSCFRFGLGPLFLFYF